MKKFVIILFFIAVFALGFLPVKDTDFGWHYRCGNQFLATGKLCVSNTFSYFLPHYQAYYSGHLYDIALAFVYDHGGFIAISLIGAIVITLSAFILIDLLKTSYLAKFIVFFVIFFLSYSIFSLGLRPQILSYLFFLISLRLLATKNIKHFFIFPFLFMLWVNIHIGFFIGLILLCLNICSVSRKNIAIYCLIIGLSFIATLINPFGPNVYIEIYRHVISPLGSMIAEWVPSSPPEIVTIIGMFVLSAYLFFKQKQKSVFDILLIIFFGLLAINAKRNLPYFYTVLFIFLSPYIKNRFNIPDTIAVSLISVCIIFYSIIQIPKTISFDTSWITYCNTSITVPYPCEAMNHFPLSGNVYSLYEWGGFLIWQKPRMKVFVDGRMPAWQDENGKSPYQVYLDIIQTKPGWNEKLHSLKTDYIFMTNGTFLDLLLRKESQNYGWKEQYRDDLAVIYKAI